MLNLTTTAPEAAETEVTEDIIVVKQRGMFRQILDRLVRNRSAMIGFVLLLIIVVLCLLAGVIAPDGYNAQDLSAKFEPPSLKHLCGTDNLGRDIFTRILYGGRISLFIGVVSTLFSAGVGIVIGLFAGFYGGRADNVAMRVLDIVMSIPAILLAITIAAALGTGVNSAIIAIGIASIPIFARLTRAPIIQLKNEEYIEAARAISASKLRIMFRHLLPNILSPLIVQITINVALSIMLAAGLSFLGLGVQPPNPEWGAIIVSAKVYIIDHSYMVTMPGIVMALTVIALNLFGDGLRDCLDPRLKI
ncbi:MAG: ABC transporter permease [Clostridiales Family XIII bacterium]|jgi:ABC-type dipeptide/oligopeptide/nickel transport system permease subunit|nr:ABC transporter permease [Clostridiales Family XIII bacterium]